MQVVLIPTYTHGCYHKVLNFLHLADVLRIVQIAAMYSFNRGKEEISRQFPDLMVEVNQAVKEVDPSKYRTKKSVEKTMPGRMLYDPRSLNEAFKQAFLRQLEWKSIRVRCEYPANYYAEGYKSRKLNRGAFREMDFVKQKLGVEVQFGKYAFMVYNVCAKMTIFHNLGHIDCGFGEKRL